MKPSVTVLLLVLSSFTAFRCRPSAGPPAQDAGDTTVVIHTVSCLADPEQSYCIALPAGFDPARKYPVIFVFDPHGYGHLAVEKFRTGAEKSG